VPPSARSNLGAHCPSRDERHFDRSDLSPTSTTGWSADKARLAHARHALSLLSRSPTPPVHAPCQGARVGASRVIQQGKCLACCLKSSDILASLSPHPCRVTRQQVFSDPGFQDGSDTPEDSHRHQPERPWAAHTHHTQKDSSREPSSASAFREALDLRPTRPGAPVLPCTPAALLRPHQTAALQRFYPRGQPRGRT